MVPNGVYTFSNDLNDSQITTTLLSSAFIVWSFRHGVHGVYAIFVRFPNCIHYYASTYSFAIYLCGIECSHVLKDQQQIDKNQIEKRKEAQQQRDGGIKPTF